MNRRDLLGVLGVTATGLVALTPSAVEGHSGHDDPEKRKRIESCAQACAAGLTQSAACAHYCVEYVAARKNGYVTMQKLMPLANDCADLCALTAKLVSCCSPSMVVICEACAKVCEACARECIQTTDEQVTAWGKACAECAKGCREIIKAEAGQDPGKASSGK